MTNINPRPPHPANPLNHEEPWYRSTSFNVWGCGATPDVNGGWSVSPNAFFSGAGVPMYMPDDTKTHTGGTFWCAAIHRGLLGDPNASEEYYYSDNTVSSPWDKWLARDLGCVDMYKFAYDDVGVGGQSQSQALQLCRSLDLHLHFAPKG